MRNDLINDVMKWRSNIDINNDNDDTPYDRMN